MDSTAIVSYVSLVLGIGTTILLAINHKRVRSNCCGAKFETSLDVEDTTPSGKKEPLVYNSPGIEKKAVTFKEES
jgi:hypothetical protein